MVLFHHAFQSNFAAGGRPTQILGEALHFGRVGVDLFFVLSGFLITGILLDTRTDSHFFKKFYSRRILRIFPLYYGALFVLFALTPLMHLNWHGMRLLLLFDLQNLRPALTSNLMLSSQMGLYHFWSLAIEEQFYLVWPAAVFFIQDRRTLLKVTLTLAALSLLLRLILVAAGAGELAIHVTTITRADSLLLGGTLAILFRSQHWTRILRLAPKACFLSFGVLALSICLIGDGGGPLPTLFHPAFTPFWISGLRYSVLAICFAGLIVCALRPNSIAESVFQFTGLRFFGKYSYGIYVFHVPVITLLLFPLRTLFTGLTHSKGIAVLGSGLIALLVAVAAAVLSFHLFEKPFLRLKRFFDYSAVQPSFRDLPPGTVVPALSSDKIEVVVEAFPRHSVSIR